MTDAEHFAFIDECEVAFPKQVHFSHEGISQWLSGSNEAVIEIGGWKGEAAEFALANYPIESWTNIDICRNALNGSVCTDPRYKPIMAQSFRWWEGDHGFTQTRAVAAHTIEHLSAADVAGLVASLASVRSWYIEAPIANEPTDWSGYHGSHILEVGWNGVDEIFARHGFAPTIATNWIRHYKR